MPLLVLRLLSAGAHRLGETLHSGRATKDHLMETTGTAQLKLDLIAVRDRCANESKIISTTPQAAFQRVAMKLDDIIKQLPPDKVEVREASSEEQFEALMNSPEMKQRQLEQMGINVQWLIERIDNIHKMLCPSQFGTWQQRAEQAELAAAQFVEAMKPIIHFIEQWDRQPLRSTSDDFYGIHHGTQYEACLRLSDFRKLLQLLRKPHKRAGHDTTTNQDR